MKTTTDKLADALRICTDLLPSHYRAEHDRASEALAAYDARKPEPPSLADALRALLDATAINPDFAATGHKEEQRVDTAAREALAAYDAQQARQADAVALIREIALTEACGNSEPDVMARALDGIIGRCEGFIANHSDSFL